MAKRKKKTTVKKRKQNTPKPTRQLITEWEGWKSGDFAWAKTFVLKRNIHGEIYEFHPEDSHGPAVTLIEIVNKRYVTVSCKTLTEKDPKKFRIRRNSKK